MKTIELKEVPFVFQGQKDVFIYKDVLSMLMETPEDQQKGANIAEIRKSLRVLDALDSANGELVLEDADFDYLLKRVTGMRFNGANKVFVDFVEYFESLS